jgi:isoaspartyl peptidase/L-asparaginase-like protein (Ntn-hydrolase superfamily)
MRVCLSFLIVEKMKNGKSPQRACEEGIERLLELEVQDPRCAGCCNQFEFSYLN